MTTSLLNYFNYTLRTIQAQGIMAGLQLAMVFFLKRNVHIQFKGYPHPVYVRATSSDPHVAFSTFVKREYTTPELDKMEVIIDLGANVGYSAIYFAKHYPNAQIVCLEPDAENFRFLKRNTDAYPNIIAINKGVWWRDSHLRLVNPDSEAWGYQFEETAGGNCPSIAIDRLIREYGSGQQLMVKMDIEGAEKDIFEHTSEWIRHTAYIQIEIHDCWKVVFDRLQSYEYRAHISGENVIIDLTPQHSVRTEDNYEPKQAAVI